ncbi:MAG: hypothetical protein AAF587_30370, partial [Bacteroidota bacterium]
FLDLPQEVKRIRKKLRKNRQSDGPVRCQSVGLVRCQNSKPNSQIHPSLPIGWSGALPNFGGQLA